METARTTREALSLLAGVLDSIDHDQRRGVDHAERLGLVEDARTIVARVEALVAVVVGEADAAKSSLIARGTPTTSWLALRPGATTKQAAGLVFTGRDLTARPTVQRAALRGTIAVAQARAIVQVMNTLPDGLDDTHRAAAEQRLLGRAATTPADRLAQLGRQVLAEVCPEQAETAEDDRKRVDAQARRARAKRALSFNHDGDGSMLLRGCLPVLDAAAFIKIIDSYVESDRRAARDRRDPLTETRTPHQRRADGLIALTAAHGTTQPRQVEPGAVEAGAAEPGAVERGAVERGAVEPGTAGTGPATRRVPGIGGDRTRVVVIMNEASLRARAEQAGILTPNDRITAGDLRRLCCNADLTPVVLGTSSEILDVGTIQRLVTPAIRRALSLRDNGCAFPGCDKPDAQCDAHHLRPWWDGGPTALHNLVSLCPHHHALVEPPRFWTGPPPDRWSIRIGAHARPETIPPRRIDPTQTPIPSTKITPITHADTSTPDHRPSG